MLQEVLERDGLHLDDLDQQLVRVHLSVLREKSRLENPEPPQPSRRADGRLGMVAGEGVSEVMERGKAESVRLHATHMNEVHLLMGLACDPVTGPVLEGQGISLSRLLDWCGGPKEGLPTALDASILGSEVREVMRHAEEAAGDTPVTTTRLALSLLDLGNTKGGRLRQLFEDLEVETSALRARLAEA